MSRVLRARPVRVGDGGFIASMMERITPLHSDVLVDLKGRIEHLIEEEAVIGAVVECIDPKCGPIAIVGTTLLGFVRDSVVEAHFEAASPALSSRLLRTVTRTSTGGFIPRKEQGAANLGEGMHQAIIEFAIDPMDMKHPDFAPVMNELYTAYFKFERGYNIKGVFVESDAELEQLVLGSGLFHHTYLELKGTNEDIIVPPGIGTKRGLYRVTRDQKHKLPPSSAAFIIMTYIQPRLRFTPAEQRLLTLAIDGLTDDDIANELDVSRDALKQTWRTIYDHTTDVMPDVFGLLQTQSPTNRRGGEKRRHIVSYVSNNLQELRPHYNRRG